MISELYQQLSYRTHLKGHRLYKQTLELRNKYAESKEKLTVLLTEEEKDLLFTFEESLNELNGVELYEMFRMGVKAGVSLARELSFCGEDIEN